MLNKTIIVFQKWYIICTIFNTIYGLSTRTVYVADVNILCTLTIDDIENLCLNRTKAPKHNYIVLSTHIEQAKTVNNSFISGRHIDNSEPARNLNMKTG